MKALVTGAFALLAVLTVPGTIELALLTLAAALPARRPRRGDPRTVRIAAIVPAHDEEDGIAACVASLAAAVAAAGGAAEDVVVVADNCRDATAARARAAGARVIERRAPERPGKGAALADAFAAVLADPAVDAVAVVDADSTVERTFIVELAAHLAAGGEAVQARYEVANPEASRRTRLMRIELLAFNGLRLRGRARLGLSVGLLGNGFALTRATVAAVPYRVTSIVEDVEYHLRLVRAGRAVRFVASTAVHAAMPTGASAARTQRARWEGGRARLVADAAPTLLGDLAHARWRALEPLLELLLAPLAYHVLLLAILLLAPVAAIAAYGLAGLLIVAAHVGVALARGGGSWRDVAALATAPAYMAWKLGLASAIARAARRDAAWVRTERRIGGAT
jgi:GT2 family glycosyltransferase